MMDTPAAPEDAVEAPGADEISDAASVGVEATETTAQANSSVSKTSTNSSTTITSTPMIPSAAISTPFARFAAHPPPSKDGDGTGDVLPPQAQVATGEQEPKRDAKPPLLDSSHALSIPTPQVSKEHGEGVEKEATLPPQPPARAGTLATARTLPPPPAALARAASAAAAAASASAAFASASAASSSASAFAAASSSLSGVPSFEHTHLATYLVLSFAVACVMHDSTQVNLNLQFV